MAYGISLIRNTSVERLFRDVISHQEAVDFARPRLQKTDNPQTVAEQLVQEAYDKGSQDNITTMIVAFKEWS